MSDDLIQKIRMAQVHAGEQAVIEHLRKLGLVDEPPAVTRDELADALRYLATAGDEYDIALDRAWDILARLDAERQA